MWHTKMMLKRHYTNSRLIFSQSSESMPFVNNHSINDAVLKERLNCSGGKAAMDLTYLV